MCGTERDRDGFARCKTATGPLVCAPPSRGEVPEWSIGAVSKTVVPCEGYRGFESHPLRQIIEFAGKYWQRLTPVSSGTVENRCTVSIFVTASPPVIPPPSPGRRRGSRPACGASSTAFHEANRSGRTCRDRNGKT